MVPNIILTQSTIAINNLHIFHISHSLSAKDLIYRFPLCQKKLATSTKIKMSNQREKDIEAVATTIYGEARGESFEGRQAVGAVIQNRYFGDIPHLKGNTLEETVSKKQQFAVYEAMIKKGNINRESVAWKESRDIATQVVDHRCPDPTN